MGIHTFLSRKLIYKYWLQNGVHLPSVSQCVNSRARWRNLPSCPLRKGDHLAQCQWLMVNGCSKIMNHLPTEATCILCGEFGSNYHLNFDLSPRTYTPVRRHFPALNQIQISVHICAHVRACLNVSLLCIPFLHYMFHFCWFFVF